MSLICPQCGAENRPQAKFCLKCAKQLVALAPNADEQARAARRRKRRRRKEAEAQAAEAASESALAMSGESERVGIRWVAPAALVVAGLAALSIAAILWSQPPADAGLLASAPVAEVTTDTTPVLSVATQSAPDTAAVLAAGAAASAALSASSATAAVTHPSAKASDPVTAAAAPPPARPAARPDRKTPERPQPVAQTVPPGAPPTPVAPPPPAAPSPPSTLCADRAFIARAVCLQSECAKPALRQHPNCVRMREQQQVLQHGSGDG